METTKKLTSWDRELEDWILEDLSRSGLTPGNFKVEPLKDESELRERLGFTIIAGIRIMSIGAYCVLYPNIPGFYRLKLKEPIRTESGTIKYLSGKGRGNHPYILPEVKQALENNSTDDPIFIVEGEKKAAKATIEGFPSIGISGVWCFKDSENDFLPGLDNYKWKGKIVFIIFDSDLAEKPSVKQAELRLAIELTNRGAKVSSVRLPNEPNGEKNGIDDFLVRYGKDAFKQLIEGAMPTLELHVQERTDTALILKEIIRLQNVITRTKLLKALAKREGVKMDAVETEYRKYLPPKEEAPVAVGERFTSEQIEEAEFLLHSTDILSRMIAFTRRMGFIGEEMNQLLLYLAFTSRLLSESVSVIIKGLSSSGKSFLARTVLRLFPESEILSFSIVTPRSLVHRQDGLNSKILYIAEHSGGEGADYSIRTLLSEGEISIMLPVKNEVTGNFETVEKRIPAKGLVFVETTTSDRVHHENQTRLIDLYINESVEQTANILSMQAAQLESENAEVVEEIKIWRAAQTLLRNHKVYIPYAHELAKAFPKEKTRARRDFPRLLSLIRAHTLLYQFQRQTDDKGRLVATIKDLKSILPLAETALMQSMKEVTPKQEATLAVIRAKFPGREFSIKELSQEDGLPAYKTLKRYIDAFTKEGAVEWNGLKGAASRYTLSAPMSLCPNRGIFPPNLLKTLEIRRTNNKDIGNVLMGSNGGHKDNKDIIRTNQNVLIKSNDDGQLVYEKEDKDNKDMGTKEGHAWEKEVEEFLSTIEAEESVL